MLTSTVEMFKKSTNAKVRTACEELSKELSNVLDAQFLSTLNEECGISPKTIFFYFNLYRKKENFRFTFNSNSWRSLVFKYNMEV